MKVFFQTQDAFGLDFNVEYSLNKNNRWELPKIIGGELHRYQVGINNQKKLYWAKKLSRKSKLISSTLKNPFATKYGLTYWLGIKFPIKRSCLKFIICCYFFSKNNFNFEIKLLSLASHSLLSQHQFGSQQERATENRAIEELRGEISPKR